MKTIAFNQIQSKYKIGDATIKKYCKNGALERDVDYIRTYGLHYDKWAFNVESLEKLFELVNSSNRSSKRYAHLRVVS